MNWRNACRLAFLKAPGRRFTLATGLGWMGGYMTSIVENNLGSSWLGFIFQVPKGPFDGGLKLQSFWFLVILTSSNLDRMKCSFQYQQIALLETSVHHQRMQLANLLAKFGRIDLRAFETRPATPQNAMAKDSEPPNDHINRSNPAKKNRNIPTAKPSNGFRHKQFLSIVYGNQPWPMTHHDRNPPLGVPPI